MDENQCRPLSHQEMHETGFPVGLWLFVLFLHVRDTPPFEGCLDLDEGIVRFLQGKSSPENFDEGVGVLDSQAILKPHRVLRGNDKAFPLLGVFVPAKTGEDVFSVFYLRYDAVAIAAKISRFRNIVFPDNLDLGRSLLLDV